jgi:CRP-like cAMP-binding protein
MVSPAAAELFLAAPWLSDLDSTARHALLNVLQEHRAEAGTELLAQGRPNERIIFQLEGESIATRVYPERGESLGARLTSPNVYGEISFFRPTDCLATVRTSTPVWYLTLDHHGHDALRRADPATAEKLAIAALRIIADRFDMIDRRVTDFFAEHQNHKPRSSEWNAFRSRLFEESSI